jgi:tRNA(fMet)-specific endonuclease VapC
MNFVMTFGLLRLPQAAAAPRLAALAQLLEPMLHLPFDRECAAIAARLRVELEAAGTPIGPHDTLIAATALRHQATLVTRNVREFSRAADLQRVNWHETTSH